MHRISEANAFQPSIRVPIEDSYKDVRNGGDVLTNVDADIDQSSTGNASQAQIEPQRSLEYLNKSALLGEHKNNPL